MADKNFSQSGTGGLGKEIIINPRIYPLDVIYSAAYVFLDGFYVILAGDPSKDVVVKIYPKADSDMKDIEKRFHSELINYALYKKQVERNSEIRKIIMQRALLTTELPAMPPPAPTDIKESDECKDDFIDDPEGIAIPWEEKYGKDRVKGKKR